jgi:hypothetical protein
VYSFSQQDAVGHELNPGGGSRLVVKADLIADNISPGPEFLTDTGSDRSCRYPAGLCAADQRSTLREGFKTEFGDLGGLSGSGIACNDDNLFCSQKTNDLVSMGHYRQLFRIENLHEKSEVKKVLWYAVKNKLEVITTLILFPSLKKRRSL